MTTRERVKEAADSILSEIVDRRAVPSAIIILTPIVAALVISGDPRWLQASLATISAFIAVDRSGMAPVGLVIYGVAVIIGYMILVASLAHPPLFVVCVACMASASVLVTSKGAELRSLGNFAFIPVLYFACETAEHAGIQTPLKAAVAFLPFLAYATIPAVVLSAVKHHHARRTDVSYFRHYMRMLSRAEPVGYLPYWEAVVSIAMAVTLAAMIVTRFDIQNGQCVIWSAASVVTGDVATARAKFRDRLVGASTGVPVGIVLGLLLPHDRWVVDLTVLAAVLTLVAFQRYVVAFAARSACAALAFVIVGQSSVMAGERLVNVAIGCVIGILLVLGVHAIASRRDFLGSPLARAWDLRGSARPPRSPSSTTAG